MTPVQFAAYIRYKTKTNATTLTDANILLMANIIKDDIAKEITKTNEDYFVITLLRNLVAGQRTYSFPTDVLNAIKYLEAQLDGVKWKWLNEFDLNSFKKPTNETSILAEFAGKEPQFDISGSQLTLYTDSAIIDVTDGLKLRSIIYPADLTSLAGTNDMAVAPSNISFGMPRQFHMVWATKVIVEYKTSKEKPIPLTERELNVDKDLLLALNALRGGNLDRTIVATVPNAGNNGADY